jgi:hypothetical protein
MEIIFQHPQVQCKKPFRRLLHHLPKLRFLHPADVFDFIRLRHRLSILDGAKEHEADPRPLALELLLATKWDEGKEFIPTP